MRNGGQCLDKIDVLLYYIIYINIFYKNITDVYMYACIGVDLQ